MNDAPVSKNNTLNDRFIPSPTKDSALESEQYNTFNYDWKNPKPASRFWFLSSSRYDITVGLRS